MIALVFGLVCLSAVNGGILDGVWTKQPTDSEAVSEMLTWFWPDVNGEVNHSTGKNNFLKLLAVLEVKSQDLVGLSQYTFDVATTKCSLKHELTRQQVLDCELDEEEVS